ncbi:MAG TPA: carboxymuconolactone decarboxylase family protein [Nocardioides sp.]|uniref:carboxymuconolactone decarboxylase family protein n=1 Tax=uncultured Nocardioides sp. TaxID=198441 RepID=UPI000EF0FA06|nr:carboxymuconolactone decarboxylase family protein [uncultured Nocardioides sp.]HCB05124.1 carboxymuconolactone decarboxylase family protein [Nocardioides sp.]HRD59815.1 carboxymuconolactone decarboxylase family protein [Nocardioides sp.]HRI94157.1 carboxymuconolactone decarboxylase family protein [Nocardioides sp.]HRK45285.1 carboxymuconolactone decarboxylase family protein [Nocardioides sp.]
MSDPAVTPEARGAAGLALLRSMLGDELVDKITERNTVAPNWQRWTTETLFGDVWLDDTLDVRTRSMITVAALVPTSRSRELENHLRAALVNGVTFDELVAIVTHVAFYAGWPSAGEALNVLKRIDDERAAPSS